jgi:hypothetical protein
VSQIGDSLPKDTTPVKLACCARNNVYKCNNQNFHRVLSPLLLLLPQALCYMQNGEKAANAFSPFPAYVGVITNIP